MSYYPAMGSIYGPAQYPYGARPHDHGYSHLSGVQVPDARVLPDPRLPQRAKYGAWPNVAPAQYSHHLPREQVDSLDGHSAPSPQYVPVFPTGTHEWNTPLAEYGNRQYAQHRQNMEHQLLVAHHLAKVSISNGVVAPPAAWDTQDKNAWSQAQPQPSPPATRELSKAHPAPEQEPMPGDEGWSWESRTSWLAPVLAPLFLQLSEAFQDVVSVRHCEADFEPEECLSRASQFVVGLAPAPQPSASQVANDKMYDDRVFLSLQGDSLNARPTWPSQTSRLGVPTSTTTLTMETFSNFVQTVLQQPLLTPTTLFLALYYALRLFRALADGPDTENEDFTEEQATQYARVVQGWRQAFKQVFMQPSTSLPFKLFVLGLMMGNKHLDDNTFLNKTWTEVTGIPLAELNVMERFYLRVCHFDLVPKEEEWASYLYDLSNTVSRRLIDSYNAPSSPSSQVAKETLDLALEMNEVGPNQYRWVLSALEVELPAKHLHIRRPTSTVSYVSSRSSPLLAPLSPASEHSTVDSLNASPYRGFEAFSSSVHNRFDESASSSISSSSTLEDEPVDKVHIVSSQSAHSVDTSHPSPMSWSKSRPRADPLSMWPQQVCGYYPYTLSSAGLPHLSQDPQAHVSFPPMYSAYVPFTGYCTHMPIAGL